MFYTVFVTPSSRDLPPPPRRVARRRDGPARQGLTVEAIVAAGIEVLDEAGAARLSMRRVAERLGTGAASLYAHVSGRDELLELIYDALVGQVPLEEPDPSCWREQLHRLLGALRDVLTSHTDAALAGLGRIPTSPQTVAAAECLVGVLRAGGLSTRVCAFGFDQLTQYVCACALEEGLFRQGVDDLADLERYFADAHAFYAALPPDRFPSLAAIGPDLFGHDADERFAFGLDVLIAGLQAFDTAGG